MLRKYVSAVFSSNDASSSVAPTTTGTGTPPTQHSSEGDNTETETLDITEAKERVLEAIASLKSTSAQRTLWLSLLERCDDDDTKPEIVDKLSRVDVPNEFKTFFKERERKKRSVYRSIATFGFSVFVVSVVLTIAWVQAYSKIGVYAVSTKVIFVLQAFFRLLGLGIYTCVPTNEFDIFQVFIKDENRLTKTTISIVLGLMAILFPVASVYSINSNNSYMSCSFIPLGLYVFSNVARPQLPYSVFVDQLEMAIILFLLLVGGAKLLAAFSGRILDYYLSGGSIALAGLLLLIIIRNRAKAKEFQASHDSGNTEGSEGGWGADEINMCALLVCIALAFGYVLIGIGDQLDGVPLSDCIIWYIGTIADITPLILLWYFTPQKAFTFIVRWYENDIELRNKDGSFMSALIKLTSNLDAMNPCHWEYRRNECNMFSYSDSSVNRRFWMRCDVRKDSSNILRACVSYKVDIDCSWACTYESATCKLVHAEAMTYAEPPNFNEWLEINFGISDSSLLRQNQDDGDTLESAVSQAGLQMLDFVNSDSRHEREPSDLAVQKKKVLEAPKPPQCTMDLHEVESGTRHRRYHVDRECRTVCWELDSNNIRPTHEELEAAQEKLLGSAKETLREYDPRPQSDGDAVKIFDDKLLKQSPREMGDVEERKRTYDLSHHITVDRKNPKKIDYFISHSWTDDPQWKIGVLTLFSKAFHARHGRYPTYWFDKVCIDQNNPTDGIAVLPINIGACENVLVLLGKTYMQRLWCIWELLTVFTFSNREVAIERIHIFAQDDGDVKSKVEGFDVNSAHCFDPNEELKLRHLMISVIGIDKLESSLKRMRLHEASNNHSHFSFIKNSIEGLGKAKIADSGLQAVETV